MKLEYRNDGKQVLKSFGGNVKPRVCRHDVLVAVILSEQAVQLQFASLNRKVKS